MYLSAFPMITVGKPVPQAVPVTVKPGLTLLPGQVVQRTPPPAPMATAIPELVTATRTTKAPPTGRVLQSRIPGSGLPATPPPAARVPVEPQTVITPFGMEPQVVDLDLAPVPFAQENGGLPSWAIPVGLGLAALLAWKLLK